jgi:HK97 family phage major capsid protein
MPVNTQLLRDQSRMHYEAARSIAAKAEDFGRDFENGEYETAIWHVNEGKRLREQAAKIEADNGLKSACKEIGDAIGVDDNGSVNHPRVKALGGGNWSKAVLRATSDQFGNYKALIPSGAAPVSIPLRTEPVRTGEPVLALRQLIPTVQDNVGRWSYLRQTVRTNNAAVVAPGAKKPTSVFSLERVENRARVIAHLSEPIARQDLSDAPLLTDFVDSELRLGLEAALENQLVNGSGVGENMTGIGNVSGAQVQAWTTDLFTTTRKAVTKLEVLSLNGTGWVLHPDDWERLELLSNNEGDYYLSAGRQTLPIDRAARRLWGIPVAVSTACTGGTGYLVDFAGSTELKVREDVALDWSEALYDPDRFGAGVGGSLFEANMIVFRAEMRAGFDVTRPSGCVSLDLTA